MSWRYQPIWSEDAAGKAFTLIEIHFDAAGNLDGWTEDDCSPMGEDWEELTKDLNRMLVDAMCWFPVRRSDLCPGFKFTPRVSMDDRRAVADFVEHSAEAMKRQPKPANN